MLEPRFWLLQRILARVPASAHDPTAWKQPPNPPTYIATPQEVTRSNHYSLTTNKNHHGNEAGRPSWQKTAHISRSTDRTSVI
ncbi:hypothetical protein B0H67DRAFT_172872 [Lasiosphaeris hirsuta]|uniref:Uncharacterized protein n=1 Tax=Lasiosphaeris hirsuta TaxID=260670 RepID=A0AA40AQ77_9PEZI|nr:hypothetical protein B0H67DRAFT_172872 [Lasiosphaeris hirsuta]